MGMKRSTAAILLVLSLGALVAGRLTAAVAEDGVDTIRLPSHGLAEEFVAEEALKPPECCNLALCTRSQPPTCRCADQVKKCAKTCKSCQKVEGSSLYVCGDQYKGYPDPMCAKSVTAGPGFAFPEATAAVAATAETVSEKTTVDVGEEEARPWDCCDLVLCNRAFPPSCRCADNVKECAKTCKSCQKLQDSSRYMCFDWYQGSKGPACTPVPPPPAS